MSNFGPDVAELLDIFYEKPGQDPDWAAIGTRVCVLDDPRAALMEVLHLVYTLYEDPAAFATEHYAARS